MTTPLDWLRITVLVENTVYRAGLGAEHGLSLLLHTPHDTILFDTGQTGMVVNNAQTLGVNLSTVTTCVLSHGHYDHAGGLLSALEQVPSSVPIHAHEKIWLKRWSIKPGRPARYIGMDERLGKFRDRFSLHDGPAEISPGVMFLGSIRRCYDEGQGLHGFFLDPRGQSPDHLPDDSGVVVDTQAGLVLITGCGHAGIRNYLDHVRKLVPHRPWAMVLGGLHLSAASPEHLQDAARALVDARVPRVGAMHCTGPRGLVALSREEKLDVTSLSVGTTLEIR